MNDPYAEIERLKIEIAMREGELAALEADVLDLQRELETFTAQYDRRMRPMAERVEMLRAVIADLERETLVPPQLQGYAPQPAEGWTPSPDYVPVEEQFWRTWKAPRQNRPDDPEPLVRQTLLDDDPDRMLKRLYRELARRYHPDLTTDPDERTRRTRLMAEINEAYSRQDLDALHALAQHAPGTVPDLPLAALELRQLRQIRDQLDRRLTALRQQRDDLFNSDMMWLSIQTKLAARQGRDLLQELLADLDREYAACLDRIDTLRGS